MEPQESAGEAAPPATASADGCEAPPGSPPASATAAPAPATAAPDALQATGAEDKPPTPSGVAPPTPASLSRPKRAGAAKASEAIKRSLKQQDARIVYQADPVEEKKARVEEAQGEGEGEGEGGRAGGGTLAANVAGGRKSGRGRGGRGSRGGRGGRGAAPAAKARVKGAPVRLGAPLQLRPIWRPSLSSEDQAAAVVVSEFAATFLGGLLSARGIPPPSPTERSPPVRAAPERRCSTRCT